MKTYHFELKHNGRHHSYVSQRASSETTARSVIRQSLKGQKGWTILSVEKRGGGSGGSFHGGN